MFELEIERNDEEWFVETGSSSQIKWEFILKFILNKLRTN